MPTKKATSAAGERHTQAAIMFLHYLHHYSKCQRTVQRRLSQDQQANHPAGA
jgi:hypothetical protein